ncbi:unnamed protein product [Fusarium venenatum]|uniref:Protein-arginine deiminase C-terminal domain-containing protein n=1 Tax=Fusarium venenatum TaxID=56646 RepID=A0A2L2U1D3_9HYPO|nr:uncharacterized protein FVRRES_04357 [Fusarium venenatum]CEI67845.1 unnamed protein product [Fusarium venenatum]
MVNHFDKYLAKSMTNLIEAQICQSPLFLQDSWLASGHADECSQFFPYQNHVGWNISVADAQTPLTSDHVEEYMY